MTSLSYYKYVNQKLWLCTEQPNDWRGRLSELEQKFTDRADADG